MITIRSFLARLKTALLNFLTPVYWLINPLTRGALDILAYAVRQYNRSNSSEAAAGLTFYAVFSLFPLLALVVTVASLFIPKDELSTYLLNMLTPVFPVSRSLIDQNIQRFATERGTFSVIGVISLLWSASNVFALLTHNINRAWENARVRNFLQRRLLGFGVIGAILAFLAISMLLTTIYDLLTNIEPTFLSVWISERSPLFWFFSRLLPILTTFLIFLLVYRFVPTAPVRYRDAFWGALLVSAIWELTSSLFTWYLGSGLARYDVLYGSIAAIAVLMFWLYLNNLTILLGAHVSAAVTRKRLQDNAPPQVTVKKD